MKRVLIIDDDEDIASILNLIFLDLGFETHTYSKATSIPNITEIKPDLILLDEWLAEITGSSLCRTLKTNPELKNIPIYLVSAVQGLKEIAKDCYADGYIEKPFALEEIEAIAKNIGR
ncbi:response regulator [Desertivirga arenae]|uniref:response regulator n=1 Tax=Desertivirga arenae TaxID=2810309 RepID=UPI001A96668B|nr:response regulator [Pedobacter sp. SYSU D00823]